VNYLFIFLLLAFSLHADLIKHRTLACPSVEILQKAVDVDIEDSLQLEMYSIANNCFVLSRDDKVEALGYDARNSKEIYQKIHYAKTNTTLYILRSAIEVEQGGKKNRLRF